MSWPNPDVPVNLGEDLGYQAMTRLAVELFPTISPNGLPDRCVSIAGTHPRIFLAIERPDVNLAIVHRDLPSHFTGPVLAPLLATGPFTVVAEGAPNSIPEQLAELLPAATPGALLQDVGDLAEVFSMLDRHRAEVRVSLQALTQPGCSRWHSDFFGLRMLCTYHGPGTEFLCREGGAAAARKLSRSRPPRATGQIAAGAIAVMKGEGHPDARNAACICRSPPPGPSARLVLRIDQIRF